MTTLSVGLTSQQMREMSAEEFERHLTGRVRSFEQELKTKVAQRKREVIAQFFSGPAGLCDYCPDDTDDDGYVCPICGGVL